MFGFLTTNMRRVVECLEPLNPILRAQIEDDAADDSGADHGQFDAIWSNVKQALRCLHDTALDQLKRQAAELRESSSVRRDHLIDAVDYEIYPGESGQIVLRDIIVLFSGLKIPAATVVCFSRNAIEASILYGFGNSETCSLLSADRLPKHHSAVFPSRDEDWAILKKLKVAESSLTDIIMRRKQKPM